MISIIIPVRNKVRYIADTFNALLAQLTYDDQVIIADNKSTDGLNSSMFPNNYNIKYIRTEQMTEVNLLNNVILNHVDNPYVLIVDPTCVPISSYLDTVFKNQSNNYIMSGRVDFITNKGIEKDPRLKLDSFIPKNIDMSSFAFPRKQAIEVGLFDEEFTSNNSNSHGILLAEKLIKFSNLHLVYDQTALVIRAMDIPKRDNKEKILVDEILKSLSLDKYKNLMSKYVNDSSSITVLLFSKANSKLKDDIKSQISKNDEIIEFHSLNRSDLDQCIKKSKYSRILLINPDITIPEDFINNIRYKYDKNKIFVTPAENTNNIISVDSSKIQTFDSIFFDRLLFNKKFMNEKETNFMKVISGIVQGTNTKVSRGITKKNPQQTQERTRAKSHKELKSVPVYKKVRSNSVDIVMPPKQIIKEIPTERTPGRPRIQFIVDVEGWAWWIKSNYLKKYLQDEFDIDIVTVFNRGDGKKIVPNAYDIYMTFGYAYVDYIKHIPFNRRVTGVTAHRKKERVEKPLKKAKYIHANSLMLYEELLNYGFENVFYVPNGVDTELFVPKTEISSNGNLIVGHVGKLSPNKGQKTIIEPAISRAKVQYISHYNTYLDKIPFTEMYRLYQNFDLFIVASKEDGTPNPALEAMSCGRPVLSNRIGNMPEIIEDGVNGFLVNKNINDYVEKIQYLKKNKNKVVEMGKNAREKIENGWTWKHQSENYRKMFKYILEAEEIKYD